MSETTKTTATTKTTTTKPVDPTKAAWIAAWDEIKSIRSTTKDIRIARDNAIEEAIAKYEAAKKELDVRREKACTEIDRLRPLLKAEKTEKKVEKKVAVKKADKKADKKVKKVATKKAEKKVEKAV